VFVLELRANDVHAALGRLLDQTRVAGLRLAAVNAQAEAGEYRVRASIDVGDREIVDRLARRVGTMIGVAAIEVSRECGHAIPTPCTAAP
jgi:acetolactate synthase regulatory subunit